MSLPLPEEDLKALHTKGKALVEEIWSVASKNSLGMPFATMTNAFVTLIQVQVAMDESLLDAVVRFNERMKQTQAHMS